MLTWIRRHPVRTAIYGIVLAAAAFLAIAPGLIAGWAANSGLARTAASRLGIDYRASAVRISRGAAEVTGLEATVRSVPPVRFTAESVRIEGLGAIQLRNLAFGSTLRAGSATVRPAQLAVTAAGVRFADLLQIGRVDASAVNARGALGGISGFGVAADSAAAEGVVLTRERVTVERAEVKGVRVNAVRDQAGKWNVAQAAALAPAGRQLGAEIAALRNAYPGMIARVRELLWWAIVVAAVLVAAAKLLLTHGGMVARLACAGVAVGIPFLARGLGWYGMAGLILGAAAAMFAILYRLAPEWHERVEPLAADLAGMPLITLLLVARAFVFPALAETPAAVRVNEARAQDIAVTVFDGRNRTTVTAREAAAYDIAAGQDVAVRRATVEEMRASGPGWQTSASEVDAHGIAASANAGSVERVAYRGEAGSDALSERLGRYPYLPEALRKTLRATFTGSAHGSAPPLRFAADANVRVEDLGLFLHAEGDGEAVSVSGIRTVPGSPVRLKDGRARVSLAKIGVASLDLLGVEAWRLTAGEVHASVEPGKIAASVQDVRLPNTRVDRVEAHASYAGNRVAGQATIENAALRSDDGTLSGDLPQARAEFSGSGNAESWNGEVGFVSARVSLGGPVQFWADLRDGSLGIPRQAVLIRQTAVARGPETVEAIVEMAAGSRSGAPGAEARLQIPRLAANVEPLGLEFRDVDLSAALRGGGARLRVETGWNRVALPDAPRPNRLETVDRFASALELKGDFLNPALMQGWRLPELPAVPERFRLSGELPDLNVFTENGPAVAIGGLSATLRRLAVPQSRVQSADLEFGLERVGSARVGLRSKVSATDGLDRVAVDGSASGIPEFHFLAAPGKLELSVPRLGSQAAQLPGSISEVQVSARYAPGRIEEVAGSLVLDRGPVLNLQLNGPLPAARARLDAPARVAFRLEGNTGHADIAAPAIRFDAESAAGPLSGEGSVAASLRVARSNEPAPDFATALRLAGAAQPHLEKARSLAGFPSLSPLRIAARDTGSPFLRIQGERLDVRGAFELGGYRTGTVEAGATLRSGTLFVEAALPVQVETGREPVTLPVQVALREAFPEPNLDSALLWDAAAVERIWEGYRPRYAQQAKPLFERSSLVLGPLSVMQVAAPTAPVRVAIGIGERLQIHTPLAARALFGTVTGTAQAQLAWSGSTPSITARVDGGFRNLEGGAVGAFDSGLHYAFVEDVFDGAFGLRADGLTVTPALLRNWVADPGAFDQFDRLGISLRAERSRGVSGPGVLQLGIDSRLKLLNAVLQTISDLIRLKTPPQRVSYDGLRAHIDVVNGVVQTSTPALEITGLGLLTTNIVNVAGDVRVRLGGHRSMQMPLSFFVRSALGGAQ